MAPDPKFHALKVYNAYMDLFDSCHKTYSYSHKSKKWWTRIYYFLLDAAVTNVYILYKETPGTEAFTMKDFVLQLAEYLLGCHNCRKSSSAQDPPPAGHLRERRFVDKCEKAKQCRVCKRRKRTVLSCKDCRPDNPIPLCQTSCFRIYHTKLNISRK